MEFLMTAAAKVLHNRRFNRGDNILCRGWLEVVLLTETQSCLPRIIVNSKP